MPGRTAARIPASHMRFIDYPSVTSRRARRPRGQSGSNKVRRRHGPAPARMAGIARILHGFLGYRTSGGPGAAARGPRRPPGVHLVRRAVEMACANSACIAVVMSQSVVTEKNIPVEAQLCRLGLIWFWNGAIQLLYQELVVSGRYSVYSTAIWMPRFLTVVHHAVLNGCWQRLLPLSVCEQVVEASSSTPSETMNSTSCGVEAGVPRPGLGMMALICDIAVSKLVSMSLLLLLLVSQLFL